ncbi:hypothetical protein U3A55_09440 [Salarchaeum sp. III]
MSDDADGSDNHTMEALPDEMTDVDRVEIAANASDEDSGEE